MKEKEALPKYPAGYEYLAERIGSVRKHIDLLEYKLANIPEDRPFGPHYRPDFGKLSSVPPKTKSELEQIYSEGIDRLKLAELERIDKELDNSPPEIRKQVREAALEQLSPNTTRHMTKEEKDFLAGEEKGKEWAQDHMDTQAYDFRIASPESESSIKDSESWNDLLKKELGKAYDYMNNTMDIETRSRDNSKDMERD